MINFIKFVSPSVALAVGAVIFVNVSGVARASDPSTLYPKRVISNGAPVIREYGTSPNWEVYKGSSTSFPLKIVDQNGNPYSSGQAQERFGTRKASLPDFEGKPDGRDQNTASPYQTTKDIGSTWSKGATFTDTIAFNLYRDTGRDTTWLSFYQEWHVMLKPYIGYKTNTHGVTVKQRQVTAPFAEMRELWSVAVCAKRLSFHNLPFP